MANYAPTLSTSPIQHLMPRRTAVKAALDALEPIMLGICERPSPMYGSLQTIFDNLLEELSVVDTVIMAMPALDMADLAAQGAIVAYRYGDSDQRVDGVLGQLLDHIDGLAA